MNRRSFLTGIIAACAAPAIVRSGLLMPVKPQFEPFVTHLVPYSELGSTSLTINQITREALRIFRSNIKFMPNLAEDRQWDISASGLRIRRPLMPLYHEVI